MFAAPAGAQSTAPIVLKLSQFLGRDSFFARDWAEPWARELEARTDGRVHVELFAGDSPLGGVLDQASQARDGTVDIALGLRGAEGDKFPRTSVIELPFLVKDAASGSYALWTLFGQGAFGPEFSEFKVLALFVQNPGMVHTAAKPIRTPGDMAGLRFRAPNPAVAVALRELGATPLILQVNDVMPAVRDGRLDGIVTNWGNPLPGFNDAMRFHTEVPFYTAVFFVVMNKARFDGLPPDVRAAIDAQSGSALVERFGRLWNVWDAPVRAGAANDTVFTPDSAGLAEWKAALRPVTDRYLLDLAAHGFPDARAVYDRVVASLPAG